MEWQHDNYIGNVKACLIDSMAVEDYNSLDFARAVLSNVDSAQLYLLRIPFRGKKIQNEFVLVQTNNFGEVQRGRIVHLEGEQREIENGSLKNRTWDGRITIRGLNRKVILTSGIKNGFFEVFHTPANFRLGTIVPQDNVLPEIIVVAFVKNDDSISYSEWLYLESLFYSSPFDYSVGGEGYGSYYGSVDGGGGGYYDGSDSYQSSSSSEPVSLIHIDPLILIDYEWQADNEPIEIEKYLKCFDAIPDAGATCSIEIFTDIPVDNDPNKIFNFNSGSPGHTFFQIKKSNGALGVTQNIGFYPKDGWKTTLTTAPIEGKFVDNGYHEFNASLKMKLTPIEFKSTLAEILYLARFIKYDIDNYNCTDFALDVFNKTRTDKLQIPLYNLPGNELSTGTRTPQGLFNKLQQMKNSNSTEASNITIGIKKGWVASSTGSCN